MLSVCRSSNTLEMLVRQTKQVIETVEIQKRLVKKVFLLVEKEAEQNKEKFSGKEHEKAAYRSGAEAPCRRQYMPQANMYKAETPILR